MLKTNITAFTVAAAALAIAGCTTPVPPPEGGYRIDNQNYVRPTLNTVRVIDSTLAHYKNRRYDVRSVLDVEGVHLSATETNFPRISVELRNKIEAEIPLEVRTSWYDASGRPVDAAASWTRVFAKPMSVVVYEQVSSNPAATQYYVEVRGAR